MPVSSPLLNAALAMVTLRYQRLCSAAIIGLVQYTTSCFIDLFSFHLRKALTNTTYHPSALHHPDPRRDGQKKVISNMVPHPVAI
ncbi:hypothetical protein GGI42DRAFT_18634 [Trichoderma sp. SZMC 28013]